MTSPGLHHFTLRLHSITNQPTHQPDPSGGGRVARSLLEIIIGIDRRSEMDGSLKYIGSTPSASSTRANPSQPSTRPALHLTRSSVTWNHSSHRVRSSIDPNPATITAAPTPPPRPCEECKKGPQGLLATARSRPTGHPSPRPPGEPPGRARRCILHRWDTPYSIRSGAGSYCIPTRSSRGSGARDDSRDGGRARDTLESTGDVRLTAARSSG